jgi:hypothetical protein
VICRASHTWVGFWVTIEMDDPSAMVTKDDDGIQQLERRGRDHGHVGRGDGRHMLPQEAAPSRGGSVTTPSKMPADSSLAHFDAELEQFAMDARRAPERIGAAHLTDQGSDFGARLVGVRDNVIATANRSESPCDAISPPSPVWRVPGRRGPAATFVRGTPIGAGRRNKAGGREGVAAARGSADVARRQARAPATPGYETGTRAWKRELID